MLTVMDRHEFYETDELVAISIFDKGAVLEDISVKLNSRSVRPI